MKVPITYQLLIEIGQAVDVVVGRLGRCYFPPGLYIYTGSAKRNLEARIARHLRSEKRLHWHIDYLLAADGVRVAGVRRYVEGECAINQATPGTVPVPGFGATDCHRHCGSHLRRVADREDKAGAG